MSDRHHETATAHRHSHSTSADADTRYLLTVLTLIVAFMAGEIAAAMISGSLALLADAGHMLTDAGALAGSAWAARLAARPPDGSWTFGLTRAGIVAAAVNGILLAAAAMLIAAESAGRFVHPLPVAGGTVLAVAIIGVAVNAAATWILARADHTSLNIRGAFAHILTDLYAFGCTAIAGLVILLAGWERADAVASVLIAVLMGRAAWGLLRDAGRILLQAAPDQFDVSQVRAHLSQTEHVMAVHDLHAWTVTSGQPTVSAHVVVADECFATGHAPLILDQLQACLSAHFSVEHVTFQLEPAGHGAHEHGTHD